MSHIKDVRYKSRLHTSIDLSLSVTAMLHDFVVVVSTRPQAMPLAMMTALRKAIHFTSMVPFRTPSYLFVFLEKETLLFRSRLITGIFKYVSLLYSIYKIEKRNRFAV